MLTLITGQKAFQAFVDSIDWHDTFFRDIVYVSNEYQDRNYGSSPTKTDLFSVIDDGPFVRLLIKLPETSGWLEIVSFNTETVRIDTKGDFDVDKTASVKRRQVLMDLGAVEIESACVGYRILETVGTFYKSIFDEDGNLVEPYNIDWRIAMDEATRHR